MKVTLKDGSFKEYDQPMSIYDIALDISEGLARVACVGEIDGETKDLRTIVDRDCTLNILTFDSDAGKKAYHGGKPVPKEETQGGRCRNRRPHTCRGGNRRNSILGESPSPSCTLAENNDVCRCRKGIHFPYICRCAFFAAVRQS